MCAAEIERVGAVPAVNYVFAAVKIKLVETARQAVAVDCIVAQAASDRDVVVFCVGVDAYHIVACAAAD